MFSILTLCTFLTVAKPPMQPPRPPVAPGRNLDRVQPQGHKPYLPATGAKPDRRYFAQHGQRFKHGYYYTGHVHPHWSYHYWDKRYGAFLYYDPGVETYYYWCAPHYRYYPVSYLPAGCRYDYDYEETPKKPDNPPPAPPPYTGKE